MEEVKVSTNENTHAKQMHDLATRKKQEYADKLGMQILGKIEEYATKTKTQVIIGIANLHEKNAIRDVDFNATFSTDIDTVDINSVIGFLTNAENGYTVVEEKYAYTTHSKPVYILNIFW